MSLAFDLYLPRPSWLHRLDPRVKIVLLLAGTAILLTFQNLFVCLAWVIANHLLFFSARAPWARLRALWALMLPVSALVFATWPLVYQEGGAVWWEFWRIKITSVSAAHGLALALRLNALAQIYFLLLFTTDQMALVRGLVRLGLPFEWGLTLAIALRYVPAFFGTFQMIAEAQQARGLRLDRGSWLQRLRAYLPILVAMIITALRTMDNLARALEARALGAVPHRTVYKTLAFTRRDWAILLIGGLAAIMLLYARLALGFGAHPLDWLVGSLGQ
jgi:energy-coupling factor transport system permease protein